MKLRQFQAVPVRVEFEPNNIEDKNAIKFDVYFDDGWHIIGFCGVNKIPKLRKAMKGKEIKSLSLLYIKRKWIPWQSKFSFYASVSVVWNLEWPLKRAILLQKACIRGGLTEYPV